MPQSKKKSMEEWEALVWALDRTMLTAVISVLTTSSLVDQLPVSGTVASLPTK